MSSFTFKQINPLRGCVFIVVYISLMFALLFGIFGFENVLNFINSFQSGKFIGLLAGIIFIVPLLFIAKSIYPSVEIVIDETTLSIKQNRTIKSIPLSEITGMALNKTRLNALDLYDNKNRLLFQFRPYNDDKTIKRVIGILSQSISFRKTVESKTAMTGGKYDIIIYSKTV